jgi:hypothetical protein
MAEGRGSMDSQAPSALEKFKRFVSDILTVAKEDIQQAEQDAKEAARKLASESDCES